MNTMMIIGVIILTLSTVFALYRASGGNKEHIKPSRKAKAEKPLEATYKPIKSMALSKRCSTCHYKLPLIMFSKRTSAKDGRQGICKDCYKTYYSRTKQK